MDTDAPPDSTSGASGATGGGTVDAAVVVVEVDVVEPVATPLRTTVVVVEVELDAVTVIGTVVTGELGTVVVAPDQTVLTVGTAVVVVTAIENVTVTIAEVSDEYVESAAFVAITVHVPAELADN